MSRSPITRTLRADACLDAIFTGSDSTRSPATRIQVKGFKMIGVRDGQATNVTVTA